jgi:hypothetical protein
MSSTIGKRPPPAHEWLSYSNSWANSTDRARPSYQAPALKHIRDSVVLPQPLNIVESVGF